MGMSQAAIIKIFMFHLYRFDIAHSRSKIIVVVKGEMPAKEKIPDGLYDYGVFQLLYLIITELKSHMTYQKSKVSHWWKSYLSKKNPLQDLFSSLNAIISTNERH